MNAGRCSSCGATVLWVVTRAGERMPLDPELDRDGDVVIVTSNGGEYGLVSKLQPASQLALLDADERPRYRSHWSTCPNAEQHRAGAVVEQDPTSFDDDAA